MTQTAAITDEAQEKLMSQPTPEQVELAAEIVLELRSDAFDGDRWLGNQVGVRVVAAVLAKQRPRLRDEGSVREDGFFSPLER